VENDRPGITGPWRRPACQLADNQPINVIEEAIGSVLFPAVDLTLVFVALVAVGAVALRFVPRRKEVTRLVLISFFFAAETAIIIALIGSPTAPVVRPQDLPRQFWLQINNPKPLRTET